MANIRKLLAAGASFTLRDINGLTALDLADRNGHENCVNILKEVAGECVVSKKKEKVRESCGNGFVYILNIDFS